MKILLAKNISKSFDDNKVIDDFSFSVDSSEVVLLEGKSGSGKTTLMRIVCNLEKTDLGSLSVDNQFLFENGVYKDKNEIAKYQKKVGMVFQNFALFPHLNVFDNLCLAPRHLGLAEDEKIEENAKSALDSLGILDKISSMPNKLSGGEKQRVAVARAIMLEPKLICFDEPTSALDKNLIKSIEGIVDELKRRKMGVFIISHDANFARRVADNLIHTDKFL